MMFNFKYATAWTYYNRTMPMNVAWNSQLALRNYSTCDVGMPFGYPRISIPDPTHYGGGPV
jgi:hypothetical protein